MRSAILMIALASCYSQTPPAEPANTGAYQQPASPAVGASDWVVLAPTVTTTNMQQTVEVGVTDRPFSQLMLKAVDGEPQIETLEIQYMDDNLKQVTVHRKLLAGDGQVIELRERAVIKKITVFTQPDSHGSYTIFGA